MKHTNTGWTITPKPGAILEWTSPTGRVYETAPASLANFGNNGGDTTY